VFALIAAWALGAMLLRAFPEALRAVGPSVLALALCAAALIAHARAAARLRGLFALGLVACVLLFERPRALFSLPILIALWYAAFVLSRVRVRPLAREIAPLGVLRLLTLSVAVALAFSLLRAESVAVQEHAQARDPVRDVLAEGLVRELPARALVFAEGELAHGLELLEREQASRPDRLLVPLSALSDPQHTAALVRRAPELTGVLRAQVLQGELDPPELQTLATQRPVFLFASPGALGRGALSEVLLPAKLYAQVSSSTAISADLTAASQANAAYRKRLEASYPVDRALLEPATRRLLREHHLLRGVLLASLERGHALTEALMHARAFAPTSEEQSELRAELLALGLSPDLLR
jgi:hypothetical protein